MIAHINKKSASDPSLELYDPSHMENTFILLL